MRPARTTPGSRSTLITHSVAQDSIVRVHLIPLLGPKKLDAITSEDVQSVKRALHARASKTVNNVLTVLSVLFKKAVEWRVIDWRLCETGVGQIEKSSS